VLRTLLRLTAVCVLVVCGVGFICFGVGYDCWQWHELWVDHVRQHQPRRRPWGGGGWFRQRV